MAATATHYEILGVRPDASADEIRRAYTELALRWHPDRQASLSPEEQERAETHMRDVNGAWSTLRNPVRRAAYDAALQSGSRSSPTRPPAGAASAPRPATGPSFADHLVDPTRPAVDRPAGARVGRWFLVVGVLLVLAGIVVFTAYAAHKPTTSPTPGVDLDTRPFAVGSCVAVVAGPDAVIVPCDQPNSGRISSTTDYPRPCPPDTYTVSLVDRQISLCLVPS